MAPNDEQLLTASQAAEALSATSQTIHPQLVPDEEPDREVARAHELAVS